MKTVLIGLGLAVVVWIAVHAASFALLLAGVAEGVRHELNWRLVYYPQQVIVACLVVGMIAAVVPRIVGRD